MVCNKLLLLFNHYKSILYLCGLYLHDAWLIKSCSFEEDTCSFFLSCFPTDMPWKREHG